MAHIHIGTSGWHYRHWVGPFYPDGMKPADYLAHYAAHFPAVEINNTFYRLPGRDVLAAWRESTPAAFVFACKASRYITHMKKLRDPEQGIRRFFDNDERGYAVDDARRMLRMVRRRGRT